MEKLLKVMLLIFVLALSLTGCRSGESKYSQIILKDYKTSLKYKNYYEKEGKSNPQYYKIKSLNRFWQEELFFVIEDDKEKSEVNLLLGIKYRGKDWVYMKDITFISQEIFEDFTLDFELVKYQEPIWKDNATLFLGVEERIALRLKPEEIEIVEKFINAIDLEVKYESDYDSRNYSRKIRAKEKDLMKEVLELYREIEKNYIENKETEQEKESA